MVIADKKMLDPSPLLRCRGGSPDRYFGEYLSGVGIYDWYPKVLCNLETQLGLAYAGRTEYDNKVFYSVHL